MADIYSGQVVHRFSMVSEDLQRIFKKVSGETKSNSIFLRHWLFFPVSEMEREKGAWGSPDPSLEFGRCRVSRPRLRFASHPDPEKRLLLL